MLTTEQRTAYDRDGYVVIDGFLTANSIAAAKADIAALLDRVRSQTVDQGGVNLEKVGDASLDWGAAVKRPGMVRKVQGAVFELPAVRSILCGPQMIAAAAACIGPVVHYHSSKAMLKPARGGAPKPWHQDAAYWPDDATDQVTAWIALDDAGIDNGCVWAIPGSHQLGLLPHQGKELQIEAAKIAADRAVPVPVRPGGLLLFHALVLHMSHRNDSDRDRWALIGDYDPRPNPALDAQGRRVEGMDERGVWRLA